MTADAILNWAANTGLSVSILIVLVLLVRKPVTKFAGAGAAYALWLLPLIRFVMPALPVLPTSPPATPVSVPHETVTYLSTAPLARIYLDERSRSVAFCAGIPSNPVYQSSPPKYRSS